MKRIYHTWDKWECYPAGFYENKPKNKDLDKKECEKMYADFLSDKAVFEASLYSVITYWKNSCEHYLSNEKMNRIAWLGQAAMCYANGMPAIFCGGFYLMTEKMQLEADATALKFLNKWLLKNGHKELTKNEAQSRTKANIY